MLKEISKIIILRPKSRLVLIYFMTSIAAIIEMSIALIAGYAITSSDNIKHYLSSDLLSDITILVIVVFFCICALLLRVAAIHYEKYFANLYRLEISKEIIESSWSGSYHFLSKKNNSELVKSITTDIDMLISYTIDPIITVGSSITSALIIFIALMVYNPMITLITVLGITSFFVIFTFYTKNKLRNLGAASEAMLRHRQLLAQHIFNDIRAFKSKPLDLDTINKLGSINTKFTWYASLSNDLSQLPRITIETIILGSLVSIILLFGESSSSAALSGLIIYGIAGLRLMPVAQRLFTAYANINYSRKFVADFFETVQNKNIEKQSAHLQCNSIKCHSFAIQKYDGIQLYVDDFEINAGQIIAISGPSGSGKTTFVDTLIGLHKNYSGSILFDNKIMPSNTLLSSSYLTQKPNLPAGTIEEIFYGCGDISKIESELKQLSLSKMDRTTYVGEFARNISGGELQRLSVIRSVNIPCSLRIFDESFNAVSENVREKVFEYIKSKVENEMVIIITHDIDIAELCDKHYKIIDNKLTQLSR